MDLPPGLLHILAQTRLFTDAQTYVILSIPRSQATQAARVMMEVDGAFSSLIRDKDELTLILPRGRWEDFRPLLEISGESPDYQLITFDTPLDLGLVGYLATVTSALAELGISIFSISAFSRDHILVPAEDFDRAWEGLRALIRACKDQEAVEISARSVE